MARQLQRQPTASLQRRCDRRHLLSHRAQQQPSPDLVLQLPRHPRVKGERTHTPGVVDRVLEVEGEARKHSREGACGAEGDAGIDSREELPWHLRVPAPVASCGAQGDALPDGSEQRGRQHRARAGHGRRREGGGRASEDGGDAGSAGGGGRGVGRQRVAPLLPRLRAQARHHRARARAPRRGVEGLGSFGLVLAVERGEALGEQALQHLLHVSPRPHLHRHKVARSLESGLGGLRAGGGCLGGSRGSDGVGLHFRQALREEPVQSLRHSLAHRRVHRHKVRRVIEVGAPVLGDGSGAALLAGRKSSEEDGGCAAHALVAGERRRRRARLRGPTQFGQAVGPLRHREPAVAPAEAAAVNGGGLPGVLEHVGTRGRERRGARRTHEQLARHRRRRRAGR
mmetsp:Transcript_1806/g.4132  ORF Transcript_1806/g.4132 Transcript_1806/m.4132 type:complete len:398 (+) Transcript_1806:398-1591(+)